MGHPCSYDSIKSEVEYLLSQKDNFKRDSNIFTLKFLGYGKTSKNLCYIIEIRHALSDIVNTFYLDTLNLLLLKKITINKFNKMELNFSNYENIQGKFMAFRKVLFFDNIPDSFVIVFDSIRVDETFNDSLFQFK